MTFEYSPVWPHGELEEPFPGILFVTGTNKTHYAGQDIQASRAMVAIRQPHGLTLVNTVRLDDEGLRALESYGPVTDIIRLGAFHGRDDPFYRDRYGATLWALPGATHADGRDADRVLAPDSALPLSDADLFVFASSKHPEAALLLRRDGGILITCDAVQSWTKVDRFFSAETGAEFLAAGRIRPANIPDTWIGACQPDASDFRKLLSLEFRHLISAHGDPLMNDAHERLSARASELSLT